MELPKNSYEKAFMLFSRLILPYVVKGVDRDKPFTDDMESAALLCLAEAQRKRGGLFGVPIEKLSFISTYIMDLQRETHSRMLYCASNVFCSTSRASELNLIGISPMNELP